MTRASWEPPRYPESDHDALSRAMDNPSMWNKAEAMRAVGLARYARTGDDSVVWRAHEMYLAAWDRCHNCDTNLGHRVVIHSNHKFCTVECMEGYLGA